MRHIQRGQVLRHLCQIFSGSFAHERSRRRHLGHDALARRVFAVQHAQHIFAYAPSAIIAQFRFMGGQRRAQTGRHFRVTARFAARIQPHPAITDAPGPQQIHLQREDLGIH